MKKGIVKGLAAVMLTLGFMLSAVTAFADFKNTPTDISVFGRICVEAVESFDFKNTPTDFVNK